ncbi:MAG: hypothetical protein WA979_05425 [Pacificimonas sp.]
MKRTLLLILLSLSNVACDNSDSDEAVAPVCSVNNPVEELAWLRDEIAAREQAVAAEPGDDINRYFFISAATYQGETIIIYDNCCPSCFAIARMFDCEGEPIDVSALETGAYQAILRQAVVIWQPKNFGCNR